MKRFPCGVVVGKFCPLHLGHERVIERAFADCDTVLIISWAKPGFVGYGRERREDWLRSRFPAATILVIDDASLPEHAPAIPHDEAPDDEHRRFVAWLCREQLGQLPDAVFTSETYGEGFAAVLSECFGKPVTHICVDRARQALPVSGTQIRTDPHAFRHFLAPEIYAGFVERICILGGESTGKTTLAQALAERLGTVWVAEYGRELWVEKNGQLVVEDMLRIGQTQVAREESLLQQACRVLVCDTSPLTTRLYSEAMFGRVAPELAALSERAYDRIFLCVPDIDFVQDGTRRDAVFRQYQHDWYLEELRKRGIAPMKLSGTLEQRLATAVAGLEAHE